MTLHLILVTAGFIWIVGATILWIAAIPQALNDGGIIEVFSRGVIAIFWPIWGPLFWYLTHE